MEIVTGQGPTSQADPLRPSCMRFPESFARALKTARDVLGAHRDVSQTAILECSGRHFMELPVEQQVEILDRYGARRRRSG